MSVDAPRSPRPTTRFQRLLHSFRFRLTLLFVGILALVLAGFSIFIYTRQSQIIRAEAVNRLAVQSAQLAAYYGAQLHADEEESEDRSKQSPQGELPLLPENTVLALIGLDGKVVLQQGTMQPDVLTALIKTWNESPATLEPLAFTVPEQAAQGNKKVEQESQRPITHIALRSLCFEQLDCDDKATKKPGDQEKPEYAIALGSDGKVSSAIVKDHGHHHYASQQGIGHHGDSRPRRGCNFGLSPGGRDCPPFPPTLSPALLLGPFGLDYRLVDGDRHSLFPQVVADDYHQRCVDPKIGPGSGDGDAKVNFDEVSHQR